MGKKLKTFMLPVAAAFGMAAVPASAKDLTDLSKQQAIANTADQNFKYDEFGGKTINQAEIQLKKDNLEQIEKAKKLAENNDDVYMCMKKGTSVKINFANILKSDTPVHFGNAIQLTSYSIHESKPVELMKAYNQCAQLSDERAMKALTMNVSLLNYDAFEQARFYERFFKSIVSDKVIETKMPYLKDPAGLKL